LCVFVRPLQVHHDSCSVPGAVPSMDTSRSAIACDLTAVPCLRHRSACTVSGITYACVGGRASQNILTYVCVYRLRNGGTQLHSPTGLVSSVAWFLVSTQPPRCGQTTLGNLAVSPSSCIRLRPENCRRMLSCAHAVRAVATASLRRSATRELCFQASEVTCRLRSGRVIFVVRPEYFALSDR
jgi:hypothetical protein